MQLLVAAMVSPVPLKKLLHGMRLVRTLDGLSLVRPSENSFWHLLPALLSPFYFSRHALGGAEEDRGYRQRRQSQCSTGSGCLTQS